VCAVIGAGLVTRAVAATRRLWSDGYVSEAGVASGPQATTYQLGVFCLGLGMLSLSMALARIVALPAGLLAVGAVFAGLSGSVACSEGCPLPPYESPTAADLVHGGASLIAVGSVLLAMIAVAVGAAEGSLRRLSRLFAWIVVPLGATAGLAMLALGKGQVTGLLERATLGGAVAWILAVCLRLRRLASCDSSLDRAPQ
jgi:Protein of unknown function (DUF998)